MNLLQSSATGLAAAAPAADAARVRHEAGNGIRLLLVVTRMDVGGVPGHVLTVLDGLCGRGYHVTLACAECHSDHRAALQRMGVRLVQLPMKRLLSPLADVRALAALVRLIRRERFQVVHTHMSKGALLGGIAARIAGAPVVVNTAHNLGAIAMPRAWVRALFRVYDRWLLGTTTDAVITVTERVRDAVVAQRILPAARVHAIANGIVAAPRASEAQRQQARRALRREIGAADDAPVIGCVARLVWFKGLDTLVDALPAVLRVCPDVQVAVAGDGPLRAELAARAAALGVADHLHLLGERNDVPQLLRGFDLFVLPSVSEGMPLTILEAMGAGLPVVATAVGGVPELMVAAETGLLVPPGDAVALAPALQRLLCDAPLRRRMGDNGRRRLLSDFSADAMVAATDALLRRLLHDAGAALPKPGVGDDHL